MEFAKSVAYSSNTFYNKPDFGYEAAPTCVWLICLLILHVTGECKAFS